MSKGIPLELQVIKLLLDDQGHANRQINKCLGRKENEKGNLLTGALKPLLDSKFIYRTSSRNTTNPDSRHPAQQEIPYYIARSDEAFRHIIKLIEDLEKQLQKSSWEQVFVSNYMNNLIKEIGFDKVYSLVEVFLKDMDFNIMASRTLLNRPAVTEEYVDKSNNFYRYLSKHENDIELWKLGVLPRPKFRENHRDRQVINLSIRKHIEILGHFYPLDAVIIYRNTIYKENHNLFSDLCNSSLITEGLNLFIQYDNYLTPFTSFPIKRIDNILYSSPFERVYEDAYVLDAEDLSKLRLRAFVIYKYFADLLFEHFRNDAYYRNADKLELLAKEFIYNWNVSRNNFDLTFEYICAVYNMKLGSGKYHLHKDKDDLIIYDLGSQMQIPLESTIESEDDIPVTVGGFSNTISYGVITPYYDPYTELKPCSCFKGMGENYPESITISQILKDIQSRFDERKI